MKSALLILPIAVAVGCGPSASREKAAASRSAVEEGTPSPGAADFPAADFSAADAKTVPEFRLRLDPPNHAVDAELEVEIGEPTTLHLFFQTAWEGYPGLASRLREVEAWGAAGRLAVEQVTDGLGPGHRIVRAARPGRITISFTTVLAPEGPSRLYHRVSQLASDGGHLLGNDLLPLVWLGRPTARAQPARVWFSGLPPDWRVISVAPRAGTGYDIDDIQSAVFIVGRLRTHRLNVGPRALTTGIFGRWPVSDERVIDAVNRIAGSLHGLAGDGWAPGDYVLGAGRVPASIPGASTGGQVLGRSGIVYVGGNGPAEVEFDYWLHTTAHELMHWYIPGGFRFADDPPRWFTEGFTDYMSLKALLVGRLTEPRAFLDAIGERFARFRASPLYGAGSVTDAETNFWDDDAYRFVYDGGTVAAFLVDLGFHQRGGSLERALREVQRQEPVTLEGLLRSLTAVRENGWLEDWLVDGSNPDWEARFSQYRLAWINGRLTGLDDWATDALKDIRP